MSTFRVPDCLSGLLGNRRRLAGQAVWVGSRQIRVIVVPGWDDMGIKRYE